MTLYTLVQHSGWTVTKHAEFAQAVELTHVNKALADKIHAAGGLVFDDYGLVADAEERENYQPDNRSLIPRVPGVFHPTLEVEGRSVYIPPASPKKPFTVNVADADGTVLFSVPVPEEIPDDGTELAESQRAVLWVAAQLTQNQEG